MKGRGSRQNLEGWTRKRTPPVAPRPKPAPKQREIRFDSGAVGRPVKVLPMQLRVGDRFTDEEGEWEVTHRPFTTSAGKLVHAAVEKPGQPASARAKSWSAHERLTVQRTRESQ